MVLLGILRAQNACLIKLEGKFLLNGMIGSAANRTAQFHVQFEVKQSQEIIPLYIYKEELNPSQCNVAPIEVNRLWFQC